MDTEAKRKLDRERKRRSYAEMDLEKKQAYLKRRRELYASRKKGSSSTNPSVTDEHMPIDEIGQASYLRHGTSISNAVNMSSHTSNVEGTEHVICPSTTISPLSSSSMPNKTTAFSSASVLRKRQRPHQNSNSFYSKAYIPRWLYSCMSNENIESIVALSAAEQLDVQSAFANLFALPAVPNCKYCNAKRFHFEPPCFCCGEGEIYVASSEMPPDLVRLYTEQDSDSVEFRQYVRTYNNNLAFTTFYAKTDKDLLRNSKGIYTFKVQGKVHHYLGSMVPENDTPRGLQFYFYDTDSEISKRLHAFPRFRESIMRRLLNVLSGNPYMIFLRQLKDLDDLDEYKIFLNKNPPTDQRTYNLPTCSQVSGILAAQDETELNPKCHIQIYSTAATPYKISHNYACYDPLQYPLLFPRGESGWHFGIERVPAPHKKRRQCSIPLPVLHPNLLSPSSLVTEEDRVEHEGKRKTNPVTCREYYCYKLQIRENDKSMLLHSGRLFQQFIVDMFAKIETSRLDFHKKRQQQLRTELLQGVLDSIASGRTIGAKVGKKFILLPSFMGGPRDMRKRYLDAMSLVQRFGKPDFFLTMTCNPLWPEISDCLLPGELPQNRPDLVTRVFRSKVEALKDDLLKEHVLGKVAAYAYSIEFQKRPHTFLAYNGKGLEALKS